MYNDVTIKRETYLSQIKPFIDTPFIKVLTGVRRCGKSTILELLRDELVVSGIDTDDVVHVNFEQCSPAYLNNPADFRDDMLMRLENKRKIYLFLDEVQLLTDWEWAVNALFSTKKVEIFVTGSNSMMLSSELATLLSGRYVQFTIRPLSFAEYLIFTRDVRHGDVSAPTSHFQDYIRFGGFPAIHFFSPMTTDMVYKAVSDIFSTVVLKDVLQRNAIRNIDLLERVVRFLLDNVGNLFSARTVSGYLTSQGRKASVDTVLEYISAFEAAHVIEKVQRYDIQGKRLLIAREKYYAADVSFIHALLNYDIKRISGVLENIVYLELRRKGFEVFVGEFGDKEIDFIATRRDGKIYVQVTYEIRNDEAVIEREFGNLLKINDQYPKYVVSLDEHYESDNAGVRHVYLPDFLLMADYL